MALKTLLCLASLLLSCYWRNRKRAVGIAVLVIRPSHLPMKLLPAAGDQSQTFPCSSCSIEQLQLSGRETCALWTSAPSPPRLHPTTQITNNEDCVRLRLSSEQTSEVHCSGAKRQHLLFLTWCPHGWQPGSFQHHIMEQKKNSNNSQRLHYNNIWKWLKYFITTWRFKPVAYGAVKSN